MKTLVKIAALATAITTMVACSWFSNDAPHSTDNQNTQIDTSIKVSEIDSSKIDTSAVVTEKDTSIQAAK